MRETAAARPLLSRPEQLLYGRLVRAFPGHVILAQVALSRILAADPTVAARGQAVTHRAAQAVLDFVVCRADFTAVAVVELEDGARPESAAGREAQRAQTRKLGLLQAAGIKMVRLAANDLPSELAIKSLVAALPVKSSTAVPVRRAS
ncbi:MAG: DUF2726 domain-containing protein [Pseudomonadota bacterium]|nr:DUF2726 domain-containing protein [Pseudomonadota bacterium]